MRDAEDYEDINRGKENFEEIYNKGDPRPYFRKLGTLDYVIPAEANPIFSTLIDELQARAQEDQDQVKVLDLGCSYGVNAALLKCDLDLDDLYSYFKRSNAIWQEPVAARDAAFFANNSVHDDLEVVGLDVADRAVDYAVDAGLLDEGLAVNLEEEALSSADAEKLEGTDLIISTGCVGYVGETTFEKLLAKIDPQSPPWVASFVLRMFPYQPIEHKLEEHGLVTEKLENHLFVQRAFASEEEMEHAVDELQRRGLDAAPELEHECYLAEFYLSRPKYEARIKPLSKLIEDAPLA